MMHRLLGDHLVLVQEMQPSRDVQRQASATAVPLQQLLAISPQRRPQVSTLHIRDLVKEWVIRFYNPLNPNNLPYHRRKQNFHMSCKIFKYLEPKSATGVDDIIYLANYPLFNDVAYTRPHVTPAPPVLPHRRRRNCMITFLARRPPFGCQSLGGQVFQKDESVAEGAEESPP